MDPFVIPLIVLFIISVLLGTGWSIAKKHNSELAKELLKLREISNDSYIKFLVDSRNSAFSYIEEVQNGLKKYTEVVEPQLKYYNTYGKSISGLHTVLLEAITPAYEELKRLMPEENKEK